LVVALCAFISGVYGSEVYRVDRTFEPVTINSDGTISGIVSNAERLTGIIGPVSLYGLNETAVEWEFVSWGQTNIQQAWTNVVKSAKDIYGYTGYIGGYAQAFDDPGWIKGIKEAYGYSGAYLWYLQNRLQFYSSASCLYQTNSYIYGIETVHVGTLGDFAPAIQTNIYFPLLDEPASTNWSYTRLTSASPGSSAETVTYRYDRTAYYKVVDLVQTLVAEDAANAANEVKDETPVDSPCSTLYIGQNVSGMATVNVTFAWDVSLSNASLRWAFTRTNGTDATEWLNGSGVFTSSTITVVWTNVANADREFNLWAWYDMPTSQIGPGPLQPNGIRDSQEPHRMVKVTVVKVELDIDGVAQTNKQTVGKFMWWNGDDENTNGIPDKDEEPAGGISNENDLVKLILIVVPSNSTANARLTIVQGVNKIKLWQEPSKQNSLTPTGTPLSLSWSVAFMPSNLFVEGVAGSANIRDVVLQLAYEPPSGPPLCTDTVKVTVVPLMIMGHPTADLYGVAWRPIGDSALVVGSGGTVATYSYPTLTDLSSTTTERLDAVTWNPGGTLAVVAGGLWPSCPRAMLALFFRTTGQHSWTLHLPTFPVMTQLMCCRGGTSSSGMQSGSLVRTTVYWQPRILERVTDVMKQTPLISTDPIVVTLRSLHGNRLALTQSFVVTPVSVSNGLKRVVLQISQRLCLARDC
jgi:hypothetical protein